MADNDVPVEEAQMKVIIEEVAKHRNGVGGTPFYVVTFTLSTAPNKMVAVVYDRPGHVAVFDRELLGKGVIGFKLNSFRGDVFEAALRKVIKRWEELKEGQVH